MSNQRFVVRHTQTGLQEQKARCGYLLVIRQYLLRARLQKNSMATDSLGYRICVLSKGAKQLLKSYLIFSLVAGVCISTAHAQPVVYGPGGTVGQVPDMNLDIDDEASYAAFQSAMRKSEYVRVDYAIDERPRVVAAVAALQVFATSNPLATESELVSFVNAYSAALASFELGDPDLRRSATFMPAIREHARIEPSAFPGHDTRVGLRVLELLGMEVPGPDGAIETTDRMVTFDNVRTRSHASSPVWSHLLVLGFYGQDLAGNANSWIAGVLEAYLVSEGFEPVLDGVGDARMNNVIGGMASFAFNYETYQARIAEVQNGAVNLDDTWLQNQIAGCHINIRDWTQLLITRVQDAMADPPSLGEAAANATDPTKVAQELWEYASAITETSGDRAAIAWSSMILYQTTDAEGRSYATSAEQVTDVMLKASGTAAGIKTGIGLLSGLGQLYLGASTRDPGNIIGGGSATLLGAIGLAESLGVFGPNPPSPEEQIFAELVEVRNDISELRAEMNERFNLIEEGLATISTQIATGFGLIGNQIDDLGNDVDAMRMDLAVARSAIDRIEDALWGMFDTLGILPFVLTTDEVLDYRGDGNDLFYSGQSPSYHNAASSFYSYATTFAGDVGYAGSSDIPVSLFADASDVLTGESIGRMVNPLRRYPALMTPPQPELLSRPVVGGNMWTQAASAYSQLAAESPWYFGYLYQNQIASNGKGNTDVDDIIRKGDDLALMMRNGRSEALIQGLLDGASQTVSDINDAEVAMILGFMAQSPIPSIDPFGGFNQPGVHEDVAPPASRVITYNQGVPNLPWRNPEAYGLSRDWRLIRQYNSEGTEDLGSMLAALIGKEMGVGSPSVDMRWEVWDLNGTEFTLRFWFWIQGAGHNVYPGRQLKVKIQSRISNGGVPWSDFSPADRNGAASLFLNYFNSSVGWTESPLWRPLRTRMLFGDDLTGEFIESEWAHPPFFTREYKFEILEDKVLGLHAAASLELGEELYLGHQSDYWQYMQGDNGIRALNDDLLDWEALLDAYLTMSYPDAMEQSGVLQSIFRGDASVAGLASGSLALAVDVDDIYAINALDPANAETVYRLQTPIDMAGETVSNYSAIPPVGHGYIEWMLAELRDLRDHALDLAVDDSYGADGVGTVVDAAHGLLANDVHQPMIVDGLIGIDQTVIVSLYMQPDVGSVVVNPDGSFEYISSPEFVGSASFTYQTQMQVLSGGGSTVTSNWATVVIRRTEFPMFIRVPDEVPTIALALELIVDDPSSVIELAPGIYREHIDTLGKAFTLRSASGDPTDTIISGDLDGDGVSDGRVVHIHSGEGLDTVFQEISIQDGSGNKGGGVFMTASEATFRNCMFIDNHATQRGGAVYLDAQYPNVTGSSPVFINCLFRGNSAGFAGGAVADTIEAYHWPIFLNCTFTQNSGIAIFMDVSVNGPTQEYQFRNCIFWENPNGVIFNKRFLPYYAKISSSLIQDGVPQSFAVDEGGNISTNPLFIDIAANDFRISASSPAIDAGDNTQPMLAGILADLGSGVRFIDDLDTPDTGIGSSPIIDMGAYEYQGTPPCPADFTGDGIMDFFDISIFLQAFANQDPIADFTDDGIWDFFDVSVFLQAFAAGCP